MKRPGATALKSASGTAVVWALLILASLFIVVPFLMVIFLSLKSFPELNDVANRALFRRILPDDFVNFENYANVLTGKARQLSGIPFTVFVKNSTIVVLGSVVPALFVSSLAAYGFAVYEFPFKNVVFILILSLLMVPQQMVSIPLFLVVARMGLADTYLGIMIPGLISIVGIYLMREAIAPIPKDFVYMARIDGANEFWIYYRVILPMVQPTLITFLIVKVFGTWNDYFWPLLIVTNERMKTIPLGLAKFTTEIFQIYNELTAGVVLSIIPMLILFFATRKYIVSSATTSGLKG